MSPQNQRMRMRRLCGAMIPPFVLSLHLVFQRIVQLLRGSATQAQYAQHEGSLCPFLSKVRKVCGLTVHELVVSADRFADFLRNGESDATGSEAAFSILVDE